MNYFIKQTKKEWIIKKIILMCMFFALSASFFFIYAPFSQGIHSSFLSMLIAVIIVSLIVSLNLSFVKESSLILHGIAILTTMGVYLNGKTSYYTNWTIASKSNTLELTFPCLNSISEYLIIISILGSLILVYFFTLLFWSKMIDFFSEMRLLHNMNKGEIFFYLVLLLLFIMIITLSFSKTDAFYGTRYNYDIIYTSDSPHLIKSNVYLTLTNPENDLRQPLFAVFSAPFIAIPYLFVNLFDLSVAMQAMWMNYIQIILLFVANLILTRIMHLNAKHRICFMLLSCCTYTPLLFSLMMEQYIIAYFWLILCLYCISENTQHHRFILWGAGGTLLTSLILLPLMSKESPIHNFKKWLCDMGKCMMGFLIIMILFCRFDVILGFFEKVKALTRFAGVNLTLTEKFKQYTEFVHNYFFAPNITIKFDDPISWQLTPITEMNTIGIGILFLSFVSLILNKDKKSSLLAAGWIGFSLIMLCVLGWGTKENGLILYSLYFGWSFLVLLFQLVQYIEEKFNTNFTVCFFAIGISIILAVINIPAFGELLSFAVSYYPI